MKRHLFQAATLALMVLFSIAGVLSSRAPSDRQKNIERYRRSARIESRQRLLDRENRGERVSFRTAANLEVTEDKSWLLRPEVFEVLNPAGQRGALLLNGRLQDLDRREGRGREDVSVQAAPGENQRVNDPSQDVDGGTQSETSVAVNGANIIVSFNDADFDNGSGYSYSTNGGATFTHKRIPRFGTGFNLGDGVVAFGPNNEVYYSTLAVTAGGRGLVAVCRSTDNGATFQTPVDAMTTASSASVQPDKSWLSVDRGATSPNKGNVYVTWTHFTQSNGGFIMLSRSTNGGTSFETPVRLSPQDGSYDVQGSMPVAAPNGDLYVAYYDVHAPNENGAISIVKSTNGGTSFSAPQTAVAFNAVGTATGGGTVRTNSFPVIATDNNGGIHIVYNGVAAVPGPDRADIYHIRSTDGGATFSAPKMLNDDDTDTTQLMPFVAVAGNGTIGVKWWDRRNDPANDLLTDVYMTVSTDGGATFSKNFRLTNHNWAPGPVEVDLAEGYHGDYDGMTADQNNFYASWSDERNNDPDVFIAQVPANQNPSAPDFNISVRQMLYNVTAGQSVDVDLTTRGDNGFATGLNLAGSPMINGLSYNFLNASVTPGQSGLLTLATTTAAQPGTYLNTATATSGGVTRSTSFRSIVFNSSRTEGAPTNASNTPGFTITPAMRIGANNVTHLAYADDTVVGAGDTAIDVVYSRSTDGGRTFSAPLKLNGSFLIAVSPSVALDAAGNIYVVWVGLDASEDPGAFLVKSTDGGASFSAPVTFSSGNQFPDVPSVAVAPNGDVMAVYVEASGFNAGLFAARSTDGGATFSAPSQLTQASDSVFSQGFVAFDSTNKAYVVYDNNNLATPQVKLVTAAAGQPFGTPKVISDPAISTFAGHLAVDGNNHVYATFYNRFGTGVADFNRDIMVIKSTDGGETFGAQRNVSSNQGQSVFPFLAVGANGAVGVAWEDDTGNDLVDIFVARSIDSGATFGGASNLSGNFGVSTGAVTATDNAGKLFVAWIDDSAANQEVFLSSVTPTGNEPPPPPPPDFSIGFPQAVQNITAPGKTNILVNINRTGGFAGAVTVDMPVSDNGKIKVITEAQTTTGNQVTFRFKFKGAAPQGQRQITFTGRDTTGRIRTGTLTLNINFQ